MIPFLWLYWTKIHHCGTISAKISVYFLYFQKNQPTFHQIVLLTCWNDSLANIFWWYVGQIFSEMLLTCRYAVVTCHLGGGAWWLDTMPTFPTKLRGLHNIKRVDIIYYFFMQTNCSWHVPTVHTYLYQFRIKNKFSYQIYWVQHNTWDWTVFLVTTIESSS